MTPHQTRSAATPTAIATVLVRLHDLTVTRSADCRPSSRQEQCLSHWQSGCFSSAARWVFISSVVVVGGGGDWCADSAASEARLSAGPAVKAPFSILPPYRQIAGPAGTRLGGTCGRHGDKHGYRTRGPAGAIAGRRQTRPAGHGATYIYIHKNKHMLPWKH